MEAHLLHMGYVVFERNPTDVQNEAKSEALKFDATGSLAIRAVIFEFTNLEGEKKSFLLKCHVHAVPVSLTDKTANTNA